MGYLPLLSYAAQGGGETAAERPLATPVGALEASGRDTALGRSGEGTRDSSREKDKETSSRVNSESIKVDGLGVPSPKQRKRVPAPPSAKARDTDAPSASTSTKMRSSTSSSPANARDTDASSAGGASEGQSEAPGRHSEAPGRQREASGKSRNSPGRQSEAPGSQREPSEAARAAAALRVQRRAVLRLQRHLLEVPRCTQAQLAAACLLLTGPELDDVAVERALAGRCGSLLCGQTLKGGTEGSGQVKLGQGKLGQLKKISTAEGAVYDARVLGRFCGSQCMREAQAAVASLPREREGLLSAQELARLLLSVGCLPQGAAGDILEGEAGTPQATAGTPQATAGTPQATAGTPQAAAGTPQAAAGTPQAAAGTPQGNLSVWSQTPLRAFATRQASTGPG